MKAPSTYPSGVISLKVVPSAKGTKPVKSSFSFAMLQWRHPPYTR
jgi:hypothetical protein